jgi:hypothetical protein
MNKKIFLVLVLWTIGVAATAQYKPIVKGMKISTSIRVKKQVYKLDASTGPDQPLIIIEGDNIVVDFNNATIKGSNAVNDPDGFFGLAVLIRNSNHVTIRNLKARGYKVALMARDVASLTLENCDFSYNYRQHLNSTQEKEDISDWMSYHHNEKDEWLRYGAAIYLRGCNMAIIRNCRVTGGQNALMMTECNDAQIVNNDFSFNSGIGIGMYRCSFNEVAFNRIDFNVRGYSHGVYNRGQDSAGILVYEQSNSNLFYKNSVTHGGDGFFLWAGQSTMDSGQGGCNNNVIFGNDFSYTPTNGVEVTFSSNKILSNRIFECDNGIWGGYSYKTEIAGNQFRNNTVGIAIEHGQENDIHHNLFIRDKTAIKLWARKEQPADWGYAKYRDTKSRDYNLVQNSYNGNKVGLDVIRTDNIKLVGESVSGADVYVKADTTVTNIDSSINSDLIDRFSNDTVITAPAVEHPNDPFKGMGKFAGRKNILMTEWGPYDFRSPIAWNINPTDTDGIMQLVMKAPAGKWKLISARGIDSISKKSGTFPDTLTVVAKKGKADIDIRFSYTGEEITTAMGETIPKGKAVIFSFRKFFQPVDWNVSWYKLDTLVYNPLKTGQLFDANAKPQPIKTERSDRIDYAWWGGVKTADGMIPQFMTAATGTADFEKAVYEFGLTWDDAVRLYIDNKLVIDEWVPSKYDFDESPNRKIQISLTGGRHDLRIEHIELGGFATVSLKIKKLQ